MRSGKIDLPNRLLRSVTENCDWIALDAHLIREPADAERRAFCSIRGLLANEGWSTIEEYLAEHGVEPELLPDNSPDHYCFAGEAPWAATFDNFATAADGSYEANLRRLGLHDDGPEVELLAVDFNWERYHSLLNRAEIGSLPSKAFAHFANLRKLPDRAEFVDGKERLAARSLSVVGEGWRGQILWVRADLLARYCTERRGEWGWVLWGERGLRPLSHSSGLPPAWLVQVQRRGEARFAKVVSLKELNENR